MTPKSSASLVLDVAMGTTRRLANASGASRMAQLAEGWLANQLDIWVPRVVTEIVRRLDVTGLVLNAVDVDAVVASADLDAAAERLDVDAVAARLDIPAVLDRVDVDAVAARLDIPAVIDRVDVDAVAQRLDLDKVLDRLDLTALVLERVDLAVLVDAVLARIDLAGIAEQVIEEIDLPEIIRESSGSMASDTVWNARMQGVAADEAVSRLVDRIFPHRAGRDTRAPAPPGPTEPADAATQSAGTR